MQSFCLGQVISGTVKGAILVGVGVLIGYLVIGLGSPFFLFLIGTFAISSIGIMGGLLDLAVGVVLGVLANWILFGLELVPPDFESRIIENFQLVFDQPPNSLGILLGGWIFVSLLFIAVVLLSFVKPGPDDGNGFLLVSLGVGIVAGLIFFFVFRQEPDLQLIKTLGIYGGVMGFIGGMLPGSPL